jgi:hypothetical protein
VGRCSHGGAHYYCRTSICVSKVRHSCNDQQDEECRDDYRRNEPAHNVIPPAQGITLHSFTLAIAKSFANFGEVLIRHVVTIIRIAS